ncbi:uncharacterized protein LOC106668352 [Cimex lectularius]|uniref:Uncharacterized protein n=1 Tax=Cimex lectularius TaxID=79782 RepID=A0A8I6RVQ3_CIMLE|nr:uncharacterized protein LOC106668352 [Cimex lectularius]
MIYEVLKREKPHFQSKIQRYYINKVKVFVSTVPVDTLTHLLLDIGNGRTFGQNVEAEIFLYDRPEYLVEAECLAAQFTIACYPWIKDVKVTKSLEEGLKDADYLLIFPRLSDINMSIENIINEQFVFLSTMAAGMDKFAKLTSKAVIVGKYESLFCYMMAVFLKEIPWNQITGLTRHIEKKVTILLSEYLKVPPQQFSGITVLGENVVDVNMAYVNMEQEMIEIVNLEDLKKADNGSYELASFNKGKIPNPFEGEEEKIAEFYNSIRRREHSNCYQCLNLQEHLQFFKKTKEEATKKGRDNVLNKLDEQVEKSPSPLVVAESPSVVEFIANKESFATLNRFDSSELDSSQPKEIYKMGDNSISYYQEDDYFIPKTKNPVPLRNHIRRMVEQRRKDRLKENYFYEDSHLKNVVLVAAVVDDMKWLYDKLPKLCENMYATNGASTARSLNEHLRMLHCGTDTPFSIMTCSMGALGFPKEMFVSGPAKVNSKTKEIVFWQQYQVHERVRIILMKQIMQLKEHYDLFQTQLGLGYPYPSITDPVQKVIKEYIPVPRKRPKKVKKSLSEESISLPRDD